jgi:glycosyltransferase involved in cell wall biosynthesis
MKVALIASNYTKISANVKKGTEIFVYNFAKFLSKAAKPNNLRLVIYASGNSLLPIDTISVNFLSSLEDKMIGKNNHALFRAALVSKAFQKQDVYDLYHVHIGNGQKILPFAPFVKKPIIVTLHDTLDTVYGPKYYSLFSSVNNVYYISISNAQRRGLPNISYFKTIYHGVDTKKFKFAPQGGHQILWAGRGTPQKGIEEVIQIIRRTKKNAKLFPILKTEYIDWFRNRVISERNKIAFEIRVSMDVDINRVNLINHYQTAKLFLNPIKWEEPFGLVMIEAMACGTPVVAYARGSVPEIIKDGVTGFIINPSKRNKNYGKWIIKKTGIEGLVEAVEKIYAMPETEYLQMRQNCRKHVEKHFTIERMVDNYIQTYKEVLADYQNRRKILVNRQ